MPSRIVNATVGRAGGLQGSSTGLVDGVSSFITNSGNQTTQMGVAQSAELLERLQDQNPNAPRLTVRSFWDHTDLGNRFEPHWALRNSSWASVGEYELDAQRANGGNFPATPRFFPGDHDGCNCLIRTEYVEVPSA